MKKFVICLLAFLICGCRRTIDFDFDTYKQSLHISNGYFYDLCFENDSVLPNGKSYEGCTIHDDWHNFQNFAEWYEGNYVEGYEVDKDLLFIGNKIYSEKTCVLVPQWLNVFANSDKSIRGDCPVGVSERKGKGDFESYCNFEGKRIHLGVFSSKESAHKAWMGKKLSIALSKKIEMDLIDKRIYPNVVSIIKNL